MVECTERMPTDRMPRCLALFFLWRGRCRPTAEEPEPVLVLTVLREQVHWLAAVVAELPAELPAQSEFRQ